MSEHRRKPPQSPGDGRAAARRGAQQQPPPPGGRRAAGPPRPQPHGTGSGQGHGPRQGMGQPPRQDAGAGTGGRASTGGRARGAEPPYQGRAAARRAAQSSQKGGRRRSATDAQGGRGGGQPPKKRIVDYPRWGKDGWRRWMPSWKLVSGLCLFFFGSLVAVAGVGYAMVGIPKESDIAKAQNNVYFWDNDQEMVATGGEVNRQNLGYSEIPKEMRFAVMSAENKTFETDSGVDPMGIARALVNMAKGGETQGGSTITQQYVKNARLGDQSQTVTRKFKELFISVKVGATVDKKEIMAGYLNSSYFGRRSYGLQAAARSYYGVDAVELNPSQCVFLASLLKGATYYDPYGNTDIDSSATAEANTKRATDRWAWILDQELQDGRMTKAEHDKWIAKGFPKPLKPQNDAQLGGQIGYLVGLANKTVINNSNGKITQEKLQLGGYRIYTTFNKKKVEQLEDAVKKVRKKNENLKRAGGVDKHVQFGGASVDPKDGKIVAIYGGVNATQHFTNNADETGAGVGSTFKPFVLAAGMTYGKRNADWTEGDDLQDRTIVSPKSIYNGKNKLKIKYYDGRVWEGKEGQWLQTNDDNESYGNVTLREAMRVSANSPYVQLGMDVGTDKVKEAALKAGLLEGSLATTNSPTFSIGTSTPSAIRMADAYSTFANRGKQNDPYSVRKAVHEGVNVYEHKSAPKQAFPRAVADNVTDVLRTVVQSGTGTSAQLPGREVAGKTGTTDGNKSAWFVGYTPQLTTSIVMFRFNDDAKAKDRKFLEMYGTYGKDKIHGASFPAEIWHDYMVDAMKGKPVQSFPTPEPLGKVVYGGGAASPTPSVSVTPSETPSSTPTPTVSRPQAPPTPTESGDCKPWQWGCQDGGGSNDGGTTDGGTGGTPSSTPSPSTTGKGNGGNGNNGGLLGGPGS
ncbi:transglycosylase domain-containing protein [Actinacidiphila glaucinigra]|uniref:transglycosylase domain-containing protein n=1 Tax=Actinacidiphila glaucinigra TaxID=235986 RepID=UPI00386C4151